MKELYKMLKGALEETEPYVEINIKQKKKFLIVNIKNKFAN